MQLTNFFLLLLNVAFVVSGQTLIKQGVNKIGNFATMPYVTFFTKAFTSPAVLSGIFLYVVSTFLWLMILSRVNLSIAYPALSMGYLVIIFISWVFLKETISIYQIIGVLLIIGGLYLIFTLNPAIKV